MIFKYLKALNFKIFQISKIDNINKFLNNNNKLLIQWVNYQQKLFIKKGSKTKISNNNFLKNKSY